MLPIFLVKYKEKVMHSGKYLNVIRECGKDIKYPYDHEKFMDGTVPVSALESEDVEMKEANKENQ